MVRRLLTSLDMVNLAGRDIAIQATRNFRALRALGITVRKTIDTVIATRCMESGFLLLYSDKDFEPFVQHLGLHSAFPAISYGRNASYPAPPAQTRTCSFPASGSSVVLAFASNKIITQIPYAVALIR
jgi:hypothetical protein